MESGQGKVREFYFLSFVGAGGGGGGGRVVILVTI